MTVLLNLLRQKKSGKEEGLARGKEEGIEEGLAKGKEESRAEAIRAVMKKLNKNADEAMDFLEIPPEERDRLRELLLIIC